MASHTSRAPLAGSDVVLDTNILLLFLVGTMDIHLIEQFKRTADRFTEKDYEILCRLLSTTHQKLTTPHILTEVSNLIGQMKQVKAASRFVGLRGMIQLLDEQTPTARELCQTLVFAKCGLADAAVQHVGNSENRNITILTDDGPLAALLLNHYRLAALTSTTCEIFRRSVSINLPRGWAEALTTRKGW